MQLQNRNLVNTARLFTIAVFLLAVVFFIPDAGQRAHKSFFAVAIQSPWSQFLDWPAAWCSLKIILLSLAMLILLDMILAVLIKSDYQSICAALFIVAIFPLLMGFFGFYELAKAVL